MKSVLIAIAVFVVTATSHAVEPALDSPAVRFATETQEVPDFQRHVVPLLGKLGCNGRACHGSFQGRGSFRLSLFGYDFDTDHAALSERADANTPADSLLLLKPLAEVEHEGGQRFEAGSWQHRLLMNWINARTPPRSDNAATLVSLQITPQEIVFSDDGQRSQLSAIAVWTDGTREDVTNLCRFQSKDDQIAKISTTGEIHSGVGGATHVVVFYDNAVVPVPVLRPVSDRTGDRYPKITPRTPIDRLVMTRLRKLGIVPSEICTDEAFLRRASLDCTGTLPTVSQVREFVADTSPDKRARKIDELLDRPGYAAWWTTRLCDYTGNSDDQLNNVTPVRTAASQHWYDWIHARVEDNVAYDDIAEGLVMAVSRNEGESYDDYCSNMSRLYHKTSDYTFADRESLPHYWSRRNFQKMEDRVIGFSYAFLGVRIQCAQCHKHPFDQWTQQDFKDFQGFFTGVIGRNQAPHPKNRQQYQAMLAEFETGELKGNKLQRELGKLLNQGETVPFGEVFTRTPPKQSPKQQQKRKTQKNKRRNGRQVARTARLPGGDDLDLTEYGDIREPLMDWLRSPENPFFARAFVNRVWANYFNTGIVNPPDDMNLANPPSNSALLDYLATEFIAHDFDMKWLHREIMNSNAYQRSWQPNETNQHDETNFSRAVPRRLPAEVSWDIVSQAAGNSTQHAELHTTMSGRAIAVPGSAVRRRSRSPHAYPLSIFGRSIRDSNCDCDRSEDPSLLQTIFMRNDSQLLELLDDRNGWLTEVAVSNGMQFTPKVAPDAKSGQIRQQETRLAALQKRLKELRETDETKAVKKKIRQLQNQIKGIRKRLKKLGVSVNTASSSGEGRLINPDAVVEEAWLRTLSRLPTDNEMKTAHRFLAEAEYPIDGLRDILWALLNTKEFIVNH